MAAQWRLLTEYLLSAGARVRLTWSELDAIVGGLPRSAVDHYPRWWHGDRPNTRAWRAAGYEATHIDPGVTVTFARAGSRPMAKQTTPPPRRVAPAVAVSASVKSMKALDGLDPTRCLIVIPCSALKRKGGQTGVPVTAAASLAEARHRVLSDPNSRTDESLVMPAWQRYDGYLYRAAAAVLPMLASTNRLLILSGGYGLLDSGDLIGDYNRIMRARDWPHGLLERMLAERAANSDRDVVAVASSTTDYAKVLRRTRWHLASGRSANLITLRGTGGASAVSSSLGLALRTFIQGGTDYPPGTVVEGLDA
jgi:hypothetical protein